MIVLLYGPHISERQRGALTAHAVTAEQSDGPPKTFLPPDSWSFPLALLH